MSKDLSPDYINSMVNGVHDAVEKRKEIETQIQEQQHLGIDPQEQAFDSQISERQTRHEFQTSENYNLYTQQRQQLIDEADAEYARVKQEFDTFVEETNEKYLAEQESAEQQLADNEWILTSVLDDSAETSPKRIFENFTAQLKKNQENFTTGFKLIESSVSSANKTMGKLGISTDEEEYTITEKPTDELDALRIFTESMEKATEFGKELEKQKLVKLFSGFKLPLIFLLVCGLFFLPLYFVLDPSMFGLTWEKTEIPWLGSTIGIAVLLGGILVATFSYLLKDNCLNLYGEIIQASLNSRESAKRWKVWAKKELARQKQIYIKNQKIVEQKRNEAAEQFQSKQSSEIKNASMWKQQELTRANEEFPNLLEKIVADRDKAVAEFDQNYQVQAEQNQAAYEKEMNDLQLARHQYLQQRDGHLFLMWDKLKAGWKESLDQFSVKVTEVDKEYKTLLLDWNDVLDRPEKKKCAGWNSHGYHSS